MEIIWHGELCFTIKGKKTTVVIDPYADGKHLLKKIKADSVLLTNDYNEKAKTVDVEKAEKIFNWPGEYEVNGAAIIGIPTYTNQKEEGDTAKGRIVIYSMMIDDIRLCHLGLLGDELDDETLSKIGDVDILMIPIAGTHCLDPKKAHAVIEAIEPRVVIPMNYKDEQIAAMLKEMGISEPKRLEIFDVKSKSQLPEETTDFIILNPAP
ncbi:MBL fold metallo-hydrolase [Candidatus Peregrinibacteria bacterium]|nr:MBL fold metallo-hydrolase [Candidatus Peregrinibacteria bacterium]